MKIVTVQSCMNGIALEVWTDVYDFRTEFCRGVGHIE